MLPRKRRSITIAFVVTLVLNALLIGSYYQNYQKQVHQERILTELDELEQAVQNDIKSPSQFALNAIEPKIQLIDARAANLRRFLRNHDSPLYDLADYIVKRSDEYNLDYRLYVAISMQESGGCEKIPIDSFNCTGLGVYGDKVWRFESYEGNIDATIKVLKERYVDRGLITPGDIMRVYTPSSDGSWARAIRYFFARIEEPS